MDTNSMLHTVLLPFPSKFSEKGRNQAPKTALFFKALTL